MNRKIKVLRIINRFNIGGPTYNATFLSAFLSDKFETLLVGGPPEKGESDSLHIPEKYGVKPVLIAELQRNPNFFSDRKALIRIKSIIQDFKPDIVHTHASKAGAIGRQAAISCNVPVILHTFHGHVFHSYFGVFKTWVFKNIERRLAKKTTAIVAISETQKKELTDVYKISNSNKTVVIPLGFDLDQFQMDNVTKRLKTRKKYKIEEETIAIAIIGRLTPIKNHTFFIKCAKLVSSQTNKNLKFFIVGDGEDKEKIKSLCHTSEPNCSFVFTSWIKDIASFNCGMDIICLCSKNEGTPVSLIEAQACNTPVVSTLVGGVGDVVEQNKTGLLSESGDHQLFSHNLLKLIENKKLREKMSQNGWNYVRDKFSYRRLIEDVEKLYLELLRQTNLKH